MEKEIRRYRNSLVTDGIGIVYFVIWSIIKIVLNVVKESSDFIESFRKTISDSDERSETAIIIFLIIAFVVFVTFILFLQLYIGLSAYKEGINGKKGNIYLVAAVIMMLINCLGMTLYFIPEYIADEISFSNIVAFFIDLTTVLILLDMIHSAIMSRKLSKQLEK